MLLFEFRGVLIDPKAFVGVVSEVLADVRLKVRFEVPVGPVPSQLRLAVKRTHRFPHHLFVVSWRVAPPPPSQTEGQQPPSRKSLPYRPDYANALVQAESTQCD
eukprot:1114478-Pleurochrysis_carterae.AAC.2